MPFPIARRWQPLTPEMWNDARSFVLAMRLIAGPGTRLQVCPLGTIISADTQGPPWSHPFKVSLASATSAEILPGFVNTLEPSIEGVKLSGTDKEPPPKLIWKKLKLDKEGRGFIALEVKADEKWQLAEAKIVQVAYLDSNDGEKPPDDDGKSGTGGVPILSERRARWGLAMLRQRKNGSLDLFQITPGDLTCQFQPRDLQASTGRAFFW